MFKVEHENSNKNVAEGGWATTDIILSLFFFFFYFTWERMTNLWWSNDS